MKILKNNKLDKKIYVFLLIFIILMAAVFVTFKEVNNKKEIDNLVGNWDVLNLEMEGTVSGRFYHNKNSIVAFSLSWDKDGNVYANSLTRDGVSIKRKLDVSFDEGEYVDNAGDEYSSIGTAGRVNEKKNGYIYAEMIIGCLNDDCDPKIPDYNLKVLVKTENKDNFFKQKIVDKVTGKVLYSDY